MFSAYWQQSVPVATILNWWDDQIDRVSVRSATAATIDLENLYEEIHKMSKKTKSTGTFNSSSWKGFVNLSLTEADKIALHGLQPSPDEILDCITEVIRSGHKISVTKHASKPACVVSFTGQETSGANNGFTLSSFAPDFYKAFMVNFYKHHYMLKGDWSQHAALDEEEYG